MYVLDTNTLIYFFKGMGRVSERMLSVPPDEIGIPAIVLYELRMGIAKSSSPEKRVGQLAVLAKTVSILPFGEAEAGKAAQIGVLLEKAGAPMGAYDILIAATALAKRAVLVTHNVNEFGRIPDLVVEDWFG